MTMPTAQEPLVMPNHSAGIPAAAVLHQLAVQGRIAPNCIDYLASSRWYVHLDAPIDVLIQEMEEKKEVDYLGIVDGNLQAMGIITRKDLFDFLGTLFGRSIAKYKKVRDYMMEVKSFTSTSHPLSVSANIDEALSSTQRSCYLIFEPLKKTYSGIFTNIDMMMYLSKLTRKDMQFAQNVMRALVKEETVMRGEGWDLLAASRPAMGLGGDCYFIKRRGADKVFICLCDVCGKGVPASLVTSYLSGLVERMEEGIAFESFIEDTNRQLYEHFGAERFVTGVFMEFDCSAKTARFVDMGHGFIYLFRKKKSFLLKTSTKEMPMGIQPEADIHVYTLPLESSDLLMFSTDGFAEQKNQEGIEHGMNELIFEITERSSFDAENLVKIKTSVLERFDDFRGQIPQSDDVTLLLLSFEGKALL